MFHLRLSPLVASATFAAALFPVATIAGTIPTFDSHIMGRAAASANVPFLVHLPLTDEAGLEELVELQGTPGTQAYHRWLTPAQFAAAFAATDSKTRAVVANLRLLGMTIDRVSAQYVTAHGSVAQIENAFGARMATFREADGRTRLASSVELVLPPNLRRLHVDVEGLVHHGIASPMFHRGPRIARYTAADANSAPAAPVPLNRYGLFGPLWFDDTKEAYRYPAYTYASGKGVTVATVNEADFDSADLTAYLQHEKIGNAHGDLAPLPTVDHVLVPGAPPFDPNDGASFEADLDTQQVAGMAPGAKLDGYTTNDFDFPADFSEVYDYISTTNSADIVSTSYGLCENFFLPSYSGGQSYVDELHSLHDEFLQGNSLGITYTVASDDSAGLLCPEIAYLTHPGAHKKYKNVPSVSAPASDPNVVAVGGGNLITSYDPAKTKDLTSTYVTENAYADPETPSDPFLNGNTITNNYWGAGTGQSAVWKKPSWQRGLTPGTTRSVPDVGLFVGGCFPDDPMFVQPCHDDVSHAIAYFAGSVYEVIGTSVAAPQFAALLADLEQVSGSGSKPAAGRLGNVNPTLYRYPSSIFHKDIPGFDGISTFGGDGTSHKWLPSYGLGSVFNKIPYPGLESGVPQTKTNP